MGRSIRTRTVFLFIYIYIFISIDYVWKFIAFLAYRLHKSTYTNAYDHVGKLAYL